MYDIAIIGAGPGGYEAAIRAAQNGMRVALFEKREVGGTCLNRGCIPTKALLHGAKLLSSCAEANDWGIQTLVQRTEFQTVVHKKQTIVQSLRGGVEALLKQNGVTTVYGEATIEGAGVVTYAGERHEAKHILIAAGAKPIVPRIPGAHLPGVMTSDELLECECVPERLLILGGGVIGVEMAEVFRAFGSHVTIVEALDRILPQMDKEISQNLTMQIKKRGVAVLTGSKLLEINREEDALCCVIEGKENILADAVLLAVGRRPELSGLLAGDLQLAMNGAKIAVNEAFETSVPGIYAIGDIASDIQLAHMASAQGIACVDALCGRETETELRYVPACVYTDPEIGSVGMTEAEARAQGIEVRTGKFVMTANGRTLIAGSGRGFIKLVFEAQTERLLGAQMMCENATDMIDECTLALANGLTRAQMLRAIRPHPTFVEGLQEALESMDGRAIHMAPARKR